MGLGHVQRSLPIIRLLLDAGAALTVLSHGRALTLLQQELAGHTEIGFLSFEDYPPLQRGRGIAHYFYYPLDLLTIAVQMRKEKQYLRRLQQQQSIDMVFADGRFGFVDKSLPCFCICHQISFILPRWLRLFQFFADVGQLLILRKFTRVIVSDFADPSINLAGRLSHNWVARWLQPIYIGFLSSLRRSESPPKKTLDLLFLIGGFIEAERRGFIAWACDILPRMNASVVLVTGDDQQADQISSTVTGFELKGQVHGQERAVLMQSARTLVGRTGYTTIMDCCEVGLSALLLPTKNMTEQEYLARRIMDWQHQPAVKLPETADGPWVCLDGAAMHPSIRTWSTKKSLEKFGAYLNGFIQQQGNGQRVFCFLQGPAGYFFWKLGQQLQQRGSKVFRITFCPGDHLNWLGKTVPFRAGFEQWEQFVEHCFREQGVTDLFLLGEQRSYHRVAVAVAQRMGIKVVVCELGYLRPEWLTLELNGMSGNSSFPRDPETIRRLARELPPERTPHTCRSSFFREAAADVSFHIANLAFWYFYPHYSSHLLSMPLLLDIGIGLHLLLARCRRAAMTKRLHAVTGSGKPFFVFPLQIENDFQIRAYSPYGSIAEALDEVLTSFARHAPSDSLLIVKEHPREVLWQRWERLCTRRAAELGLNDRVVCLDGGSLDELLVKAAGTVTINSTSGLQALIKGCPTKVLGAAIYDLTGLTDQASLDQFWQSPKAPDLNLRDDYVRLLRATIQVKGSFYDQLGESVTLEEIADRLIENRVNQAYQP